MNNVFVDLYNSQNSSVTDVHKTKSLTKKKNRYPIELMESQLRNPTRKTSNTINFLNFSLLINFRTIN